MRIGQKAMLLLAALLSPCAAQDPQPGAAIVRLHLPRSVWTEKVRLTLGDVAVIHSDSASRSAKAAAVLLGRAPWPGEKLAITRTTILSRLASCGVATRGVRFSGAEKVTVERKAKVVSAEQIARLAADCARKARRGADDGATLEPIGTVREMVLPVTAKVELKARPAATSPAGCVAVEVLARRGESTLASARVLFRRMYARKVAVAVMEIKPGETITPANAKIETLRSPRRPRSAWRSPFGLLAAKTLRAGERIAPAALSDRGGAVAAKAGAGTKLKRNDRAIIRLRGPGFVIMAMGVVLEDGKVGDTVQVRNMDTQRVMTGKIAPDGAVEPPMR